MIAISFSLFEFSTAFILSLPCLSFCWFYYSINAAACQSVCASPSCRRRVYHQFRKELYIIKPQENTRWRVMRYKGGLPPLMICTALRAAMICQACGLDKKIPKAFAFGIFWRRVDKKYANSNHLQKFIHQ